MNNRWTGCISGSTYFRTLIFSITTVISGATQVRADHMYEAKILSNCRTATTEQHPIVEYQTTMDLLEKHEYNEAVYCFYRGQLRYRIHLSARPELDPSADPALFGSMNGFLGAIVNKYAYNNLPSLLETIDEVLTWHENSDDTLTPKSQFPDAHEKQREGLMRLREQFADSENEHESEGSGN